MEKDVNEKEREREREIDSIDEIALIRASYVIHKYQITHVCEKTLCTCLIWPDRKNKRYSKTERKTLISLGEPTNTKNIVKISAYLVSANKL